MMAPFVGEALAGSPADDTAGASDDEELEDMDCVVLGVAVPLVPVAVDEAVDE